MSLFDPSLASRIAANRPQAAAAKSSPADRDPTLVWVNVGYNVPVPMEDDPTQQEVVFVSLPMGLPVDTMKPRNTNTSNMRMKMLWQAQNALLEKLTRLGLELEPGTALDIPELSIQVRHVRTQEEVPAESNIFMMK